MGPLLHRSYILLSSVSCSICPQASTITFNCEKSRSKLQLDGCTRATRRRATLKNLKSCTLGTLTFHHSQILRARSLGSSFHVPCSTAFWNTCSGLRLYTFTSFLKSESYLSAPGRVSHGNSSFAWFINFVSSSFIPVMNLGVNSSNPKRRRSSMSSWLAVRYGDSGQDNWIEDLRSTEC